ncbi:acyltransferase [Saccharopolyspora shandongensis]|uniref:acyltransferase family protein n=1 Tax=Saccharopolyspora shandongensis TaxID=418495 RepID=UPI00341A67ED
MNVASPVQQPARLHEIDLLRITAALAVVFYHYTFSGFAKGQTGVAFPTAGEFSRYGYLGVDLFFVISGFVVLLSALNRSPEKFVISRIVRLYPAFWVSVTLTSIVSVLFSQGMFQVSPLQYLANVTMFNPVFGVDNIDVVYWTLWAELRFYVIIFVLTCIGITRRRLLTVMWAWLAATFLLESGLLPLGLSAVLDYAVQSQYSHYFIAGMALCLVYRFGPSWSSWAIVAVALGNAVYRGVPFSGDVAVRYRVDLNPAVVVTVIAAIFLLIALVALGVTSRIAKPWFATAGSLTYPLYLIHAHIGFVVFSRLQASVDPYVLLFGTVLVMCLVAWGMHVTVERRFGPLLKRSLERLAAALRHRLPRTRAQSHSAGIDPPTEPLAMPVFSHHEHSDGGRRAT